MGKKLTDNQVTQQYLLERIAELKFATGQHQEEKWNADNSDPNNVCPICQELDALGWVPFGLLPKYKKAHSVIGEGRWKAPDSSCQCVKGYRRASGPKPSDITPLTGNNGDNPLELYFKRVEDVKSKIEEMKKRYGHTDSCDCCH